MQVRKAVLEDSSGIAKVQVDSWRTTYKGIVPDSFLDNLNYEKQEKMWEQAIPKQAVFVAENEEREIVGFVCGGENRFPELSEADAEIYAIYILKEYQRQGIGKKLVKPLFDYFKSQKWQNAMVLVLEDNPSKQFYEHLGGKWQDSTDVEIGGKNLKEAIYVWENLQDVKW